ncbi:MAG: hypothetical protein ACI8TX_000148 [Hyphomicrobiaceae bacterium]|jgi:hypothetical protein
MKRLAIVTLLIGAIFITSDAYADQVVGSVTGTEGSAELSRGEVSRPARIQDGIQPLDIVRTGPRGRIGIVFLDETVLNLGNATTLVVDQTVYDPDAHQSVFELLKGTVRALVSEHYSDPLALFQIKTPNSVTGVRGTDFVVSYDESTGTTDVSCLGGTVVVHSTRDLASNSAHCSAGRFTRVAPGEFPAKTAPLPASRIKNLKKSLSFVGSGRSESSLVNEPILGSTEAPPPKAIAPPPPNSPSAKTALGATKPSLKALSGKRQTPGSLIGQPPNAVRSLGTDQP